MNNIENYVSKNLFIIKWTGRGNDKGHHQVSKIAELKTLETRQLIVPD